MIPAIKPEKRICGYCEGERVLFEGAPGNPDTRETPCDHCNGRGYWIPNQSGVYLHHELRAS